MKREYTQSEIELVEAVVGLFIILPNPQLKDKKDYVMKIAFQVLDDMIEKDVKHIEETNEDDDDVEEADNEDILNYMCEKFKKFK